MAASQWPVPGDIVRIRDERWRVVRCTSGPGGAILDVDAYRRDRTHGRATFLLPFDRCEQLPRDAHPRLVSRTRWRRTVARVLADAVPAWGDLRTAAAARIDLLPFQLEPALALMRGRASRVLIADGVGLGKTIQAGLMIAETLARFPDGRVLVVAPASLRDQWQAELQERFALAPRILDAARIHQSLMDMPAATNPWAMDPVVITSIDFVKRPDVIRALETLVWDLVVFDEAHGLAGRSDRARAASALGSRARSVVLLTATPAYGDEEAFRRLCQIGELQPGEPITIFRRARDSGAMRTLRRDRTLHVRPTPDETAMHAALTEYAATAALEGGSPAAHLAVAVLQRRAASSATSLASSVARRLDLLGHASADKTVPRQPALPFGDVDEDAPPGDELGTPALASLDAELRHLERILHLARAAARHESKVEALVRFLRRASEPAIVFTQYRDTLVTLAEHVGRHVCLHGGMAARERMAAVHAFTRGDARLLLATDAASEGLNLHTRCRLVINLEVPWTMLRLEQRAGRVDRLGQQRTVHAVGLVAADTEEERLARHLSSRSAARTGRAESRAPGEPAGGDAESTRLHTVRALRARAALRSETRPVIPPVSAGARRAFCAFQVDIVAGDPVWDAVIAFDAAVPFATRHTLAAMLEMSSLSGGLEAALSRHAAARVALFRREIMPLLDRLEARERAIVEALHRSRARLSRDLLQPGLFDRRTERAADAQRQLLDRAEAYSTERLEWLARLRGARLSAIRPLFGIATR
jgi:superfamily II DNA or RNA helicase